MTLDELLRAPCGRCQADPHISDLVWLFEVERAFVLPFCSTCAPIVKRRQRPRATLLAVVRHPLFSPRWP